jgi:hypothetical protein
MKKINLPLIFFTVTTLSAGDLKTVPQQAEVIQPESDKKELPAGKLEMSISIDNDFTSSIAKDISDLQDKLKNSAKETVNDSMKAIGKEIKSSITDIVKEAVGSMPKPEPAVTAPTPLPIQVPIPAPTLEPKVIVNDIILARSIAEKQNKKLIVFFGHSLCKLMQDIMTCVKEEYIIKSGDEYIILLLDEVPITANELVLQGLNKHKGWQCWAGIDMINIDYTGNVFSADCGQGPLGTIQNFTLPGRPLICGKERCSCLSDIYLRKEYQT